MTKRILLCNDDGIESPALFAAAAALSELGEVTIAAPNQQWSGAGRSTPGGSDHTIVPRKVSRAGHQWTAFAIGGTPAQTVQHALIEICPEKPDLVVSGINYGENFGTSITTSGTVGAAMEAASWGVPAMAISLQLLKNEQFYNYEEMDFSVCKHFTKKFAAMMLNGELPTDVDVININIPGVADVNTPWRLTKLARHRYYKIDGHVRENWSDPCTFVHSYHIEPGEVAEDSDIHAVIIEHCVSVTPISIDMTSRVDMKALEASFRKMED